jgi:hypothetical protein
VDGNKRTVPLSDLAAGTCRYVVIYSPQCAASKVLARQWQQQLNRERGEPFPPEWTAVWVSVVDSTRGTGFFPAGFSLARAYAAAGSQLSLETGVHAYPAHLLLDRDGIVAGGGLGAPLPPRSAFHSDCSVRLTAR